MLLTGVTENPASLHTAEVMTDIAGLGFTVTRIVKSTPEQLPEVGVTVYIAVCAVFVGLISVPLIFGPLPAAPPVRPPVTVGADHE